MIIFDTEGDGLLDDTTQLWICSWTEDGKEFHSTPDPQEFLKVLDQHNEAGCHFASLHDFPVFEKLYGYKYKGLKIDTWALSDYLYPKRPRHGLADWGEEFGFPKVEVKDDEWKKGEWSLMKERCERDVLINWMLWEKELKDLESLYG